MADYSERVTHRSIWALALVVGTLSYAASPANAADKPAATVVFQNKSYEPSAQDVARLTDLAKETKGNPSQVVTISEYSVGKKPGSLPYIIERDRALRVFQVFAKQGVNPAQVKIEAKSPGKADANHVTVESRVEAKPVAATPRPSGGDVKADSASEFVVNFPSASAEPVNLSAERFSAFLAVMGQPGHDAVVIEGYTDSQGNPAYNQALGELRALSVYERLARAGLPAYRIDTKSFGQSKSNTKSKGTSNEADRRVVIRWTTNAAVAAQAAKEAPAPVAAAVTPPPSEPAPAPAPVEEPKKADTGTILDIVPFAGLLMPRGELGDHAKNSAIYGLGLGKEFWHGDSSASRVTLSYGHSAMKAKQSDRAGDLRVNSLTLRADYVFTQGAVRPFLGAGFGRYFWEGSIKEPSTGLRNSERRADMGGLAALGLDVPLISSLVLSPEFTWTKIGGDFDGTLLSGWLALRWGI